MEIATLESVTQIKKCHVNEMARVHIDDQLHISSEAGKRAEWLEMLKAMPDIRAEAIPSSLAEITPHHISVIAKKIQDSGF